MTASVRTIKPATLPVAYADADMGIACPNCQAASGEFCRRPDGHYRRTPCLKRMYKP
jgi:hypothetical protein